MESDVDEESQDSKVIDIIPVHFDESYENTGTSSSPQQPMRGKYYKQTYRTAWEQMSDFKGWLRGVQGQPTRAFCTYCQKTLHAHRLSLLKHTCTIRHQKAAQIYNTRKNKPKMDQDVSAILSGPSSGQEEGEVESEMIEFADQGGSEDGDQDDIDQDQEDIDDEEESIPLESLPVQFQKQFRQSVTPMATSKPPISTHVLDTSKGHPIVGLQVSLYKLIDGRWTYINEGITNPDGRFANFLDRNDFNTGRYKLHFDVDRYFEARKQDTLYPFIEIVFDCRTVNEHYHVPLLLSPFGYTTYRGS